MKPTNAIERRFTPAKLARIEVRTSEGGASTITGHALVYDRMSQDLGGFVERCQRGCATKTIGEADIRALFNHDPNLVLGRSTAGTLRLADDATGLGYEIDPPASRADVIEAIQRGDVTQSSFAFRCIADDWSVHEGRALRTLEEVAISDVSPVTYPAYLDADSGVRSALVHLAERRSISPDEAVAIFRDGQLSALIEGKKVARRRLDAKRADPTYNDRQELVNDAIAEAVGSSCWVRDMTDDWAVYEPYNCDEPDTGTYRVSYTLDADNKVTLGKPEAVTVLTTYQPVGTADGASRRLELLRRRYPAA